MTIDDAPHDAHIPKMELRSPRDSSVHVRIEASPRRLAEVPRSRGRRAGAVLTKALLDAAM